MGEQTIVAKINGKNAIITALIGGVCLVISAFIGIFSFDISKTNETLTTENTELVQKNDVWENAYNNLMEQYDELSNKNISLSSEIDYLKNNISQYSSLVTENTGLINENNNLKNDIEQLQKENEKLTEQLSQFIEESFSKPLLDKKVSIFNLDTFQGEAHWYKNTSFPFSEEDDWLIDMYGNEFHTGYIAFHGDEKQKVDAIYNLDNKYSQCNIKMAWPRGAKNLVDAGAYIKFYADGELLDTSPEIKCGDEPIEFSINLSGVEKFSFERIATGNSNPWMTVTIIYCYFDLIENEI